jgi:carbamoyltransferase
MKAVTHVDNTARLQTVTKVENEFLWNLLDSFEAIKGFGVLLNTSFNTKGRPILTRIQDALEVLDTTQLDYLYVEGYLFSRKPKVFL